MVRQNATSFRMKQIDELIMRSLSTIILQNIDFPDGLIFTITKVLTTKDFSTCKIFYICNLEDKHAIFANIIKKNLKEIRELLADEIIIRKMPVLKFIFDAKEAEALHMDQVIDSLHIPKENRE